MNTITHNCTIYTFKELSEYKNLKVLAELERLNNNDYKNFCNWRIEEYSKNRNKKLRLLKTYIQMKHSVKKGKVNEILYCDNNCDIEELLTETLPHGSGIDCDWEIKFLKNGKIKCCNYWHKMNDNGYYCGFTDFYLVISYTETDKIEISNVKMSKGERFGVREYLNDIFHYYETELNK